MIIQLKVFVFYGHWQKYTNWPMSMPLVTKKILIAEKSIKICETLSVCSKRNTRTREFSGEGFEVQTVHIICDTTKVELYSFPLL